MKKIDAIIYFILLVFFVNAGIYARVKGVKVGTFLQEVRTFYSVEDGVPDDDVFAVAVAANGHVYAGTRSGLAIFANGKWTTVPELQGWSALHLAANGDRIAVYSVKLNGNNTPEDVAIFILRNDAVQCKISLPEKCIVTIGTGDLAFGDKLFLGTAEEIFAIDSEKNGRVEPQSLDMPKAAVRQIAVGANGSLWIAGDAALFKFNRAKKRWQRIYPRDGEKSWAPVDVRGVAWDRTGKFWFASPQGVGRRADTWKLFTGKEGLPYNDFTTVAAGEKNVVWFGTHRGAIRFDGSNWEYRQGLRWLPDDNVRDIAVTANGDAWFATVKGVGVIRRRPMTLAEKAKWYEDEIDRYHRRTPYEYVLEVTLLKPGDKSKWRQHDSDNDGLWTSMYGAGECFAYAATKDPKAKERAKKAFEALRFLGRVTRGTKYSPPPGYVARTILPTGGPDPNVGRLEGDIRNRKEHDRLWKVYEPRWPVSADGKWYWKTDTSSDELDGHYFFYAQYYDLVAETEAEKTRVRRHVQALTDHLIEHDFNLIDHDGKPTRWARYNPYELNHDKNWFTERGLKSLSMLSYLAVAEHITGDVKYRKIADELIEKHSYLQNMMWQKFQRGMGTGNQSDDEMAFMCYYNLLRYDRNPGRLSRYAVSFWQSWRIEEPEMNPFFNFAVAAVCAGITFTDAFGPHPTDPVGDWLEDAIETLKRFPLDRVNWRHQNSRRIDILPLPEANEAFDDRGFRGKGYRVNGKVIPVDECYFNHWNRDPWRLDSGGNGRELGDGAVFLLPYYMGLYHGFIVE